MSMLSFISSNSDDQNPIALTQYFYAYYSSDVTYALDTPNQLDGFDTTTVNAGSNFNTTNSNYVAPTDGIYIFNIGLSFTEDLASQSRVNTFLIGLQINSTEVFRATSTNILTSNYKPASHLVSLSSGDIVDWYFQFNDSSPAALDPVDVRGVNSGIIQTWCSGYRLRDLTP